MLILGLYIKLPSFCVFTVLKTQFSMLLWGRVIFGRCHCVLYGMSRLAQCILKYVNSWQSSPSFWGENQIEQNGFLGRSVPLLQQPFSYFDVGWHSLSLCLPCWVQKSVSLKSGLGLLPSGGELFPWRILMPHLHLGIVKGNRSPALQSSKPLLLGGDLFFSMWSVSFLFRLARTWREGLLRCNVAILTAGSPWVSHRDCLFGLSLQYSSLL